MIKKLSCLLLLLLCSLTFKSFAQDTLWVKKIDGKAFIAHKAQSGEDIFLLSKKYNVPPAVLADVNNLSYQSGLSTGSTVWIPVDNYNFIRVESVVKSKPIYYKVNRGDALKDVTRMINVAQSTLQMWNHMSQQELSPGQVLLIGWVAFDAAQVPFTPKNNTITNTQTTHTVPVIANQQNGNIAVSKITSFKDSVSKANDTVVISPYEQLYEDQITGHANNEESGAAVFYPIKMKLSEGVYYAFHNTAPKGTIIKVTNPANSNIIYAKVIGTIPKLADYNNCIIALSTNAAKGLMAKERRMFCRIEYR